MSVKSTWAIISDCVMKIWQAVLVTNVWHISVLSHWSLIDSRYSAQRRFFQRKDGTSLEAVNRAYSRIKLRHPRLFIETGSSNEVTCLFDCWNDFMCLSAYQYSFVVMRLTSLTGAWDVSAEFDVALFCFIYNTELCKRCYSWPEFSNGWPSRACLRHHTEARM